MSTSSPLPAKRALVREQLVHGPKRGELVDAAAEAAQIPSRSLIAAASALRRVHAASAA